MFYFLVLEDIWLDETLQSYVHLSCNLRTVIYWLRMCVIDACGISSIRVPAILAHHVVLGNVQGRALLTLPKPPLVRRRTTVQG